MIDVRCSCGHLAFPLYQGLAPTIPGPGSAMREARCPLTYHDSMSHVLSHDGWLEGQGTEALCTAFSIPIFIQKSMDC